MFKLLRSVRTKGKNANDKRMIERTTRRVLGAQMTDKVMR